MIRAGTNKKYDPRKTKPLYGIMLSEPQQNKMRLPDEDHGNLVSDSKNISRSFKTPIGDW